MKLRILIGRAICDLNYLRFLFICAILYVFLVAASAQEFSNIEYLCADWGPAMTLPAQAGDQPKYSDTEEEVYFLKQVNSFTRRKRLLKYMFGGQEYEDTGKGVSIYLCKMKPDGSGKTEIKELWKNPNYPVDTQTQSTWLNVNRKNRKIALSITLGGSDLTGLWTVRLDGTDLRHLITPILHEKNLQSINHPSWTPDGQCIVFSEAWRGAKQSRVAKCDHAGGTIVYITDGPADGQPRLSPNGKQVAFIRWIRKGVTLDSWLWLVNIDGSDNHPLPNPQAKPTWSAPAHWGTFPAWSPDGQQILISSYGCECIDITSGRKLFDRRPMLQGNKEGTCGWPHWGRAGFVGFNVGGILFTDLELREAKWIGASHLADFAADKLRGRW